MSEPKKEPDETDKKIIEKCQEIQELVKKRPEPPEVKKDTLITNQ